MPITNTNNKITTYFFFPKINSKVTELTKNIRYPLLEYVKRRATKANIDIKGKIDDSNTESKYISKLEGLDYCGIYVSILKNKKYGCYFNNKDLDDFREDLEKIASSDDPETYTYLLSRLDGIKNISNVCFSTKQKQRGEYKNHSQRRVD